LSTPNPDEDVSIDASLYPLGYLTTNGFCQEPSS